MKWLVPVGVVVGLVALGALIFGGTYNSLNTKSQNVDAKWAQVQSQYQRRYDLIPNLVESTKGFFEQERAIFDSITSARTAYSGAKTAEERVTAANQVESALGRLLVIVEQNPQIKSDATVARLMDELAGTENRVATERMRYNESVQEYNTTLKSFPTVLVAGMFGFKEKEYFEAQAGAEQAPKVEF